MGRPSSILFCTRWTRLVPVQVQVQGFLDLAWKGSYKELLSYNKVRTEGAGRLAGVLPHCASLAHLNLSNNDIGAAGAESFAGVLGQCPVLVHLYLGGNGIEAGFELLYKQSYRSIPADDEPSQSCNFCKMRL